MGIEEGNKTMGFGPADGGEELTWEKLLKRAPVSVLLVEQDDSTSQIISVLLRKCGYRVTVASDGLKAWVIMREKYHNIDLVLTEVDLPKMSGVSLLTMMMAHENCKNLPVIMLSSNDSISIAFNCMIKGASDFLVKPIRKNELINLWQHVWRKQKNDNHAIPRKKLRVDYDYRSIENSTHKQDDKACSEKESDAQSSCTRSDMEVESACTLQTKMELKQVQYKKIALFDQSINSDKHFDKQLDGTSLFPNDETIGHTSFGSDIKPEVFEPNEVINYQRQHVSIFDNCGDESTDKLLVDIDLKNKTGSMPSLQLSLKTCPQTMSSRKENGVSNILHHSDSSAFSLYNYSSKVIPTLPKKPSNFQVQNSGSCSSCIEPLPPYQSAAKPPDYDDGLFFNADDTNLMDSAPPPKQVGTTFRCTPIRFVPFPVPIGGVSFDAARSNSFLPQSPFYPLLAPSTWNAAQEAFFENLSYQSGFTNDFKSAQRNHPEDHSCRSQSIQSHHPGQIQDAEPVNEQRLVCGQSKSGSADTCHESNHRPVGNMVDISEENARSGDPDGLQMTGMIKPADAYRLSQREAALSKFRLKRKERCFEKKVRYLSRKKLAEQRPRVKGQFVRQMAH